MRIGQLHERLVPDAGAEAEETGGREVGGGDEDAWAEGGRHGDAAGLIENRGGDDEPALAQGEGVASSGAEGREQARVHQHPAPFLQLAPRAGGVGPDLPVERIPRLDSGHLDQPDALGAGHVGHAGEAGDLGLPAGPESPGGVGGHERVEQRLDARGELPAAGDRQVGAEQRLGLPGHGSPKVRRERVHGDEGGDSGGDGAGKQQETAARSSGFAPCHPPDEWVHQAAVRSARRGKASITRRCDPRRSDRRRGGWCAGRGSRCRGRA